MPRNNVTHYIILFPVSTNLSSVQISTSLAFRNLFLKLAVVREDCLTLLGDSLELFIQVFFIDIWSISKSQSGKREAFLFHCLNLEVHVLHFQHQT